MLTLLVVPASEASGTSCCAFMLEEL
jgi:hypothetical protein